MPAVVLITILAKKVAAAQFPAMGEAGQWIIGMSAAALGPLLGTWVVRRRVQQRLRIELVKSGKRICLTCGYDLRGSDSPRCPECGNATGSPSGVT
ncbi:MAG TPA: hypothetical protein VNT79_12060 [Phycisphaerae bacterium]|nr:hypothetical protein [Phycisphaerae bacterium]